MPNYHETNSGSRAEGDEANQSPYPDQGVSEELIAVLARVHKLSRSMNPDVVDQLRDSTYRTITEYETLSPAGLLPALTKQRAWLEALIDECRDLQQQRQLFEIASQTSGLLGYIAVGCASFSLARAYCLESFQLSGYAEDRNLMAWARGMQSFCEYYAGRYDKALS